MGSKRLPPPFDDEDAGGFSNTRYLKTYFQVKKEFNKLFEEVRAQMLKDLEVSTKIYDV